MPKNGHKLQNFKAAEEDIDRWKEIAYTQRKSLSKWIRETLNAAAGVAVEKAPGSAVEVRPTPAKPEPVSVAKQLLERAKAGKCERRVPKGAFCSRCGRIHG